MTAPNKGFYTLVFLACTGVACWDAFTTYVGISNSIPSTFSTLLLTLLINGIVALTYPILKNKDKYLGGLAKVVWAIAIMFDCGTSFMGNKDFAGVGRMDDGQWALVACLALFTISGSVAFSYLLFEKKIYGDLTD